jgi:hypothetical protein
MKHTSSHPAVRKAAGVRSLTFALAVLLLFAQSPAWGLWLPWATEQDKIQRTLNDVWQGLVANNLAALQHILGGNGVGSFIKQETDLIKSQGIKNYNCTVKKIQYDPTTGSWAFVEYEKTATMEDSNEVTTAALAVLQKTGGQWKMIASTKDRRKAEQKEKKAQQERERQAAADALAPPDLPTAR